MMGLENGFGGARLGEEIDKGLMVEVMAEMITEPWIGSAEESVLLSRIDLEKYVPVCDGSAATATAPNAKQAWVELS